MRAILTLLVFFPLIIVAQERCATNNIAANKPHLSQKAGFEKWMHDQLASERPPGSATNEAGRINSTQQQVYEIPVVFHVVHDGSPIGTSMNISKARIEEQISILNQDFRRQNEDASETPELFLPVAADTEIQFVLARQDPEGLPTDGIVRVTGSKAVYNPDIGADDILLKSESFWPPEDYLNVYVTDLTGGYLGYAQYPFSNIPGIKTELENYRNTDGVAVDYQWIGTNDNTGSFNSRGRTLTHEIGHYLGLRHIWGDSKSCSADDFCQDTPPMSGSNTGKSMPCSFPGRNSCEDEEDDLPDMFQNFMDYTDDECMNLFTACQRQRMRAVLELSPRRFSLLTSHALHEPVATVNDLGIRSIISPTRSSCSNVTTPGIEIRNYGTNDVTSFEAELYLNGALVENLSYTTPLKSLEIVHVNFSSLTIPPDQENEITFHVSKVNEQGDGETANNTRKIFLPTVQSQLVPYSENFEENSSGSVFRTTENQANSQWLFGYESAFLPFYKQTENFGIQDMLLTEVLDLSSLTSAELTFRYAYAARNNADFHDGLIVAVSTNCGQDFLRKDFLFEAYGTYLGSAAARNTEFIPSQPSEWRDVSINLTNYTGHENVQIAFIGVNGGGNNIFLDDISISSADLLAHDAGIKAVSTVPVVSCSGSFSPFLDVKNFGYTKIESLDISVEINGAVQEYTFGDLNMLSGFSEKFKIDLDEELDEGIHEISFHINQINGLPDEQPANNSSSYQVVINSEQETIPVKEDFTELNWIITSPTDQLIFEKTHIGRNDVLVGRAFDFPETGIMSYLVSPVLETLNYTEASIRFKYSYGQRTGYNDNLKVLLSFNCGRSFGTEVFNLNSEQLAVTNSNVAWEPANENDWKTAFIDISQHLTWDDLRVAIVFTGGNGNNLYIDDLEIITSADPHLPEFDDLMVVYPNPTAQRSFQVALNLFEKQDVEIRIVDMSGKVVFSQEFPASLNQTYHFETPAQGGFYLIQMLGSDGVLNQVKRLYIKE